MVGIIERKNKNAGTREPRYTLEARVVAVKGWRMRSVQGGKERQNAA